MKTFHTSVACSDDDVLADTRRWLERAVIGLNLCPFAKSVYVKEQIRYVVSAATSEEALQHDLTDALKMLHDADPSEVDTILLIHPHVLTDFLDFNDFLHIADATVVSLGLEGEIQIASFHPQYQFAGTEANDMSNYTNRAPYPTLHLLREDSIDRAVAAFPDASDIFERNIEAMRQLGIEGWNALSEEPATDKKINDV